MTRSSGPLPTDQTAGESGAALVVCVLDVPSHYNFLIGLMPHSSPKNVYASEYYKRDFLKYNERLGAGQVEFKSLIPKLYLPSFLKESLGYSTHAMVTARLESADHSQQRLRYVPVDGQ